MIYAMFHNLRFVGLTNSDSEAIQNLLFDPSPKAAAEVAVVGPEVAIDDEDGSLAEPMLTFADNVERLTLKQFRELRSPSLKRWRKSMGLSQTAAAEKFGVSESSWRRYETGRQVPPPELLAQLY